MSVILRNTEVYCRVHKVPTNFWSERLKVTNHLEDLGVYRKMDLKEIFWECVD
jgi:hypothetical protein